MEYTHLLNRAAVEKDPYVKLALAGELDLGARVWFSGLIYGFDSQVAGLQRRRLSVLHE